MAEIDENITFTNDDGKKLDVPQKYVGLKLRQEGILTVNFRCPKEEMDSVMNFFKDLDSSEPVKYNIGNTGDVDCYFKGIAPLLEQTDDAGFKYYFLSVTLQELKAEPEEESCGSGCSL